MEGSLTYLRYSLIRGGPSTIIQVRSHFPQESRKVWKAIRNSSVTWMPQCSHEPLGFPAVHVRALAVSGVSVTFYETTYMDHGT